MSVLIMGSSCLPITVEANLNRPSPSRYARPTQIVDTRCLNLVTWSTGVRLTGQPIMTGGKASGLR